MARPGADWLDPRATLRPRPRSLRTRVKLVVTAALLFAAAFAVWRATGQVAASAEPLSFFFEEEKPDATGIHFVHEMGSFAPFFDNVKPFMRAVSASACTADVDGDGDLDLYFTTAGDGAKNALFFNDGGWRFHRAEGAAWAALDGDNGRDGFSSDCVFADVDNDGFPDLFVGAVAQRPHLFHNDAGHGFTDVSAAAGVPDYMNGFAVSFFDFDADGDLDLLLSSYFGERYLAEDIPSRPRIHSWKVPDDENAGRMMPNNWGDATNGGQKHFLLNDGTGHFTAVDPAAYGFTETRFTFDIGTGDLDGDGFTDVYFANDFGPDQLYFNDHGRGFVEVKGVLPTEVGRDSFKGMDAEIADIDNDGLPEIYVTNVFHPVLPEGNILWKNLGGRRFENVAAPLGVKDGGWGWGAKLVDIDLDGDTDLVETNGYISQNPDKAEYWYRLSRLVAGDRRFIVDTRKWPPFEDLSMSGHQVSHVFVWDAASHRFFNRAADAGVTRSFDGRGVLIADLDEDGRPDVLYVAQGAPYFLGHNVFRPTPQTPAPPHWVGVIVKGDGAHVNKDGVGVRVEVRAHDARSLPPLYREVSAGNGMSAESMPWVLAGLGAYAGPVDVTVRWTDGTVTAVRGLPADRYHTIVYGAARAVGTRPPASGAATSGPTAGEGAP